MVIYCSVEFSLLPPDEQKETWSQTDGPYMRPITSVQLQTRHWIMKDESGEVTSEVRGEGVIGEFPILVPGRLIVTFSHSQSSQCCRCPVDFAVLTGELSAAVVTHSWLACVKFAQFV